MLEDLKLISSHRMHGGMHQKYSHRSKTTNCEMTFSIYLPPGAGQGYKKPVVYWLSGLTCNDDNFSHKAGAQRWASELEIVLVIPDTSPRGDGVADDPEGDYDLGLGAGFYINATREPWSHHYKMYDYVVHELPELIESAFPVSDKRSISGHSMGGHGALTIALKNSDRYRSVSAFSPIVNPIACPWGKKAFSNYLGDDINEWKMHDTVELIKSGKGKNLPILVDQGTDDSFLKEQLLTERLVEICSQHKLDADIRYCEGYDHSYFFIASYIEEHLRYHAARL